MSLERIAVELSSLNDYARQSRLAETSTQEMLKMLSAQVQALHDAIAAQSAALASAMEALSTLESNVASLSAKLAAVPAQGMSPEDQTELGNLTNTVSASVTALKAAMPAAITPAAPDAAAVEGDKPAA